MYLTKEEVKTIKHWYKDFSLEDVKSAEEVRGKHIRVILLISRGRRNVHSDSKYPIITTIGIEGTLGSRPTNFYNLGSDHDSICINFGKVALDSLGKNIFQIWSNSSEGWVIAGFFSPMSDLNIGCEYPNIRPTNQIM